MRRRQGAFTLLELLVVMSLLGLVAVGFGYLYANSQQFLAQSVAISATQGEASFALEHIKRQLLRVNWVLVFGTDRIAFRYDPRPFATQTPQVDDDQWDGYRLNGTILNLVRSIALTDDTNGDGVANGGDDPADVPAGGEVIARNITAITFERNNTRRVTVNVTAEQAAAGGGTQKTELTAVIGLKGIF